jgi:hypothetical protein
LEATVTESSRYITEEDTLQLLRRPDLTRQILDDMEALGCVADERARLLTYLIAVSRKLPRPLSGLLPPGPHQQSLADVVEQMTSEEHVLRYTRMSEPALGYLTRLPLPQRLIIVEHHADPEEAERVLRELRSMRRSSQVLPVEDSISGVVSSQYVEGRGPVAYLTADPRMSCSFEIPLDDGPEQTQRLLKNQLARRLPSHQEQSKCFEAIVLKHQQAQRKLMPSPVCIPYAEQLSFPGKGSRSYSLQESFLGLIEASAVLHQHQRKWGATETRQSYILADCQDYRLAYELAGELVADGLSELSRGARKLWAHIRKGVADPACFYRKELHDLTGLDTNTLKEHLQELVELEYIEGGFEAKAYRIRYRLLVDQEEARDANLLTPEELEERLRGRAA